MPKPQSTDPPAVVDGVEPWEEIRVLVPRSWKRWLQEASKARAMSVADLVRQCIRALMITRHDNEGT